MPGNLGAADLGTPTARVMPNSLCRAFSHRRDIAAVVNQYQNGESQVSLWVTTGASRKSWTCPRRLTSSALATLRSFYDSCNGPQKAFFFYDLVNHKDAVYDPSGTATTGRYTVRFDGPWQQTSVPGRSDCPVSFVEIA